MFNKRLIVISCLFLISCVDQSYPTNIHMEDNDVCFTTTTGRSVCIPEESITHTSSWRLISRGEGSYIHIRHLRYTINLPYSDLRAFFKRSY